MPAQSIDICNRLLRAELAAVATYDQALNAQIDAEDRLRSVLRNLKERHQQTLQELKKSIRCDGGTPSVELGKWTDGSPKGPDGASLAALLHGEKRSKHAYQEAVDNGALSPESRELINDIVLPRIVENIVILRTVDEQPD